jgi:hypothetical protein
MPNHRTVTNMMYKFELKPIRRVFVPATSRRTPVLVSRLLHLSSSHRMSSLTRLNIQDPWDLTIFAVVACSLLFICFILSYDAFKMDFRKSGREYYQSSNQRIVFYFGLFVAALYKFLCMLLEALLFSDTSCTDSHFCTFVRFSPDVTFLAAYSLLVAFWAQVSALSCSLSLSLSLCLSLSLSLNSPPSSLLLL